MHVVSLFDGLSGGRSALEAAGLTVSSYTASEVDKPAIKVAMDNFPDINQIGDVREITDLDLPVRTDLLMAGSPCQGFSKIGNKLAFDHPKSALFFDFLRVMDLAQPKYFLLENVKMRQEWQDVISGYLGVQPIKINSALVSVQNRERLYWTNIPGACVPEDRGLFVRDIVDFDDRTPARDSWHRWWGERDDRMRWKYSRVINDADKAQCMVARQFANWNGNLVDLGDGTYRFANRTECEIMQTMPVGYTKAVSVPQAYKMLGNGWTREVIVGLLSGLAYGDVL